MQDSQHAKTSEDFSPMEACVRSTEPFRASNREDTSSLGTALFVCVPWPKHGDFSGCSYHLVLASNRGHWQSAESLWGPHGLGDQQLIR